MPFTAGPWELASVFSKVLSYASLASLAGGFLILWLGSVTTARISVASSSPESPALANISTTRRLSWLLSTRQHLCKMLLLACVIGSLAVVVFFLLQVGVVNQNGIAGMFDGFMAGLLLQSPIGYGSGLKLAGFGVAGIALLLARPSLLATAEEAVWPPVLIIGAPLAIFFFAVSFAVLGHVASLGVLAWLAIALHISAMGLWIGALYPLHALCRSEPATTLQPLLQMFGNLGWAVTGSLLLAGIYLLTELLERPLDLFTTPYGLLLVGKMLLVICLLGLAALNKFRLVPAIANAGVGTLQRAIRAEMFLVLLILLLTASLTTLTGPVHLM